MNGGQRSGKSRSQQVSVQRGKCQAEDIAYDHLLANSSRLDFRLPKVSTPQGCGHSCLDAQGREPPGLVFWSGGLCLQAPWQEWAPGTRWEATALTAWLRRSAKDRHCLSVGPGCPLPHQKWFSLPPMRRKPTADPFKCCQHFL